MANNMYLYEKAREVYYQDLRREVEGRRLLAQLPRQSMGRQVAGKLGLLLLKAGAWLKQFEQPSAALEDQM